MAREAMAGEMAPSSAAKKWKRISKKKRNQWQEIINGGMAINGESAENIGMKWRNEAMA